tara:strand:+ start:311 stop:691 length:381 start_codon:yes stop_codon:yes gene_type:complete
MRLTKRQLKQIIREEYSRLKRRGLIREMYATHDTTVDTIEQIKRLESAFYFIATSSTEASAAASHRHLDRLEAEMDPVEFGITSTIAELKVEYEENFEQTSQRGREMRTKLDRLCAKVGISFEDLL